MIQKRRSQPSNDWRTGWCGPIDSRWSPLLAHIEPLTQVEPESISSWLSGKSRVSEKSRLSEKSQSGLLIAIEHRNDPQLSLVRSLLDAKPKVADWSRTHQVACVLGRDWQGHRRTFPLPDGLECFYWHQWYDGVLPWLARTREAAEKEPAKRSSASKPEANSKTKGTRSKGSIAKSVVSTATPPPNLRVERLQSDSHRFAEWIKRTQVRNRFANRIAWVVSDDEQGLALWQTVLEAYGVRTIASRVGQPAPRFSADFTIIDLFGRSSLHEFGVVNPERQPIRSDLLSVVEYCKAYQPASMIAVVDPFSEWSTWSALKSTGADLIVGRPCSVPGVLYCWEAWLEAQPVTS